MVSRHSVGAVLMALSVASVGTLVAQSNPKISARDQVTVTVANAPDISGKFPVDAEGVFIYPPTGAIKASGLTIRELEAEIEARLRQADIHRSPRVTVELQQIPNKLVTVTGAVHTQGQVTYSGEITLFDAIGRAGGVSVEAGDVLVVRTPPSAPASGAPRPPADDQVLTANLQDLMNGNLKNNFALHDGDRVIVQRAQSFFVTGYVNAPGAYTIGPGMTLQQALALAGDISEKGTSRGIRILRRVAGKDQAEELKNVKLTDPVKPGDTIIVRKSIF